MSVVLVIVFALLLTLVAVLVNKLEQMREDLHVERQTVQTYLDLNDELLESIKEKNRRLEQVRDILGSVSKQCQTKQTKQVKTVGRP